MFDAECSDFIETAKKINKIEHRKVKIWEMTILYLPILGIYEIRMVIYFSIPDATHGAGISTYKTG